MLSTAGSEPHAIPVSTAVRATDRLVLVALAIRRESLTRLRADPRTALTLLAEDDVAITAHCRARIVADPMSISDRLCAVALDVLRVQDTASRGSESTPGCAGTGLTSRHDGATPRCVKPCPSWWDRGHDWPGALGGVRPRSPGVPRRPRYRGRARSARMRARTLDPVAACVALDTCEKSSHRRCQQG